MLLFSFPSQLTPSFTCSFKCSGFLPFVLCFPSLPLFTFPFSLFTIVSSSSHPPLVPSALHTFFSPFLYIFSPQGNDQSLITPFLTPWGLLGNLSLFPEDPRKGMSGELVWSCLYFLGPWGTIKPHDLLRKFFSMFVVCRHEWGQRCLWDGCKVSADILFLLQDRDSALTLSSTLPSWRSQVVGHSRDSNSLALWLLVQRTAFLPPSNRQAPKLPCIPRGRDQDGVRPLLHATHHLQVTIHAWGLSPELALCL